MYSQHFIFYDRSQYISSFSRFRPKSIQFPFLPNLHVCTQQIFFVLLLSQFGCHRPSNFGYLETIVVHPTRRQNFAGKLHMVLRNIWDPVISQRSKDATDVVCNAVQTFQSYKFCVFLNVQKLQQMTDAVCIFFWKVQKLHLMQFAVSQMFKSCRWSGDQKRWSGHQKNVWWDGGV